MKTIKCSGGIFTTKLEANENAINRLILPIALCALVLGSPLLTGAATSTWDGGGTNDNWVTAANWTNNTAPGTGANLIFPSGANQLNNLNGFANGTTFGSLTFSGSGYVISGNRINLTNGLAATHANILGTTAFDPIITLQHDQTFSVPSSRAILGLNGFLQLNGYRLTVDNAGAVNMNNDVIGSGTVGGITKTGIGRLTIAGDASYVDTTSNLLGTIWVNGSLSNSPIVLITNATLGGYGTIKQFTTHGGTVHPGTSTPGSLRLNGLGQFDPTATFSVRINGPSSDEYDSLIGGFENLSSCVLDVLLGYSPVVGETFSIIQNATANAVNGQFLNWPEGATNIVNGVRFRISYTNNNNVTLTAIYQEPTGTNHTWSGLGTNNLWMNRSNWVGNVAPSAGDDLIFPPGAAQPANINDFPAGTTFNNIIFSGSNYNVSGNAVLLNAGAHASNASGNNTVNLPIILGAKQTFTNSGGGGFNFNGAISGSADLTKAGAGKLSLNGTNTYTGLTIVAEGGLNIGNNSALGSVAQPTIISNGASLNLSGNITIAEPITLAGSLGSSVSTNSVTGSITLASNSSVLSAQVAAELIVSGAIQGAGSLLIGGAGITVLSGSSANSYSGSTTVLAALLQLNKSTSNAVPGSLTVNAGNSSVIRLGTDNQIAADAAVTLNDGTTLDLNHQSASIGALTLNGNAAVMTGAGTLTLSGDLAASPTASGSPGISGKLVLAGPGGARVFNVNDSLSLLDDLVISAAISSPGSLGLIKTGAGRLTLTANSSYNGAIEIDAGELIVNGSIANSTVSLNGGTLGGFGTVGSVASLPAGGNVAPGTSPGFLYVASIDLNPATTLIMELNGVVPGTDYDQLHVAGGLVSLGNCTLAATLGFTPAYSNSFKLIDNTSTNPVAGTFKQLPEGAVFMISGILLQISYSGGDGNDVVLSRLPPPPTLATASASGNSFLFQVIGEPGVRYTVEASTNLVNWQAISAGPAGADGTISIVDAGLGGSPKRFYRARSP